jgi:hypothetical protein
MKCNFPTLLEIAERLAKGKPSGLAPNLVLENKYLFHVSELLNALAFEQPGKALEQLNILRAEILLNNTKSS